MDLLRLTPLTTDLLTIYLRDHLAGATAGLELIKRAHGSNRDSSFGAPLAELRDEFEADRDALIDVLRRLGVSRDRVKETAGWVGEKVGRLKLNGRLVSYSPLSRVLELEGLAMAVSGKAGLWRTLIDRRGSDPRLAGVDLAELLARAERQRDRFYALHAEATAAAFGSGSA